MGYGAWPRQPRGTAAQTPKVLPALSAFSCIQSGLPNTVADLTRQRRAAACPIQCCSVAVPRSLGAEVNWGIRFRGQDDANAFLTKLAGEVANRLAEAGVKVPLLEGCLPAATW